ncbi:hypothetical protein Mpal_1272 [Methanosphaerula palustris E1-9c]|uniref:Uncharacterized protein n=1 Tax=Methanosphaerula palustris (strain ATCC BAA-1556 / DSM 19958 / E1-9c) TaxID=521011 RepID=B8GHK1_METPE|nr:hypothetical protein Mpal_1272 [Methanosphaerula palustris E1-9c]
MRSYPKKVSLPVTCHQRGEGVLIPQIAFPVLELKFFLRFQGFWSDPGDCPGARPRGYRTRLTFGTVGCLHSAGSTTQTGWSGRPGWTRTLWHTRPPFCRRTSARLMAGRRPRLRWSVAGTIILILSRPSLIKRSKIAGLCVSKNMYQPYYRRSRRINGKG